MISTEALNLFFKLQWVRYNVSRKELKKKKSTLILEKWHKLRELRSPLLSSILLSYLFSFCCKPRDDRSLKFPMLSNLVSKRIMPVSLQDLDAAGRWECNCALSILSLLNVRTCNSNGWSLALFAPIPGWFSRESRGSRDSRTGGCGLVTHLQHG